MPDNPALKKLVESDVLRTAQVGVYVYDDSAKKIIADYQSDKYFVPASNTKLFSLYAGMKYLGDSIEGMKYYQDDTALFILPTGDPTLLHPDFQSQPVVDFLKKQQKNIYIIDFLWNEKPLGPGWAWDDYNDDYSVERSQLPVYGNFIRWNQQKSTARSNAAFGETVSVSSSPEISWPVRFNNDSNSKEFTVRRSVDSNVFTIHLGTEKDITIDVPFITNNLQAAIELLPDTLGRKVYIKKPDMDWKPASTPGWHVSGNGTGQIIYSRPVDSVFVPMMLRSDNFFAEQTLLMAGTKSFSKILTGPMREETFINYLLSGPLADLPQKPNWVDGSGLSRYNLFTPQDFVSLLIKFKNEFGMDRMKRVLPTGGAGTLKNYYKDDSGYIFLKTGSMTGVICISGFLYTNKKHLLEFSVLVNNHVGSGSAIRREVETFVEELRKRN